MNDQLHINKSELAKALDVSLPTIQSWINKGLPYKQKGDRGKDYEFYLPEVLRWVVRNTSLSDLPSDTEPEALTNEEMYRIFHLQDMFCMFAQFCDQKVLRKFWMSQSSGSLAPPQNHNQKLGFLMWKIVETLLFVDFEAMQNAACAGRLPYFGFYDKSVKVDKNLLIGWDSEDSVLCEPDIPEKPHKKEKIRDMVALAKQKQKADKLVRKK